MHYYPHHIGDFNAATRHLTRIERSIYRDLIELYYDTEEPLPNDLKYIARKIVAIGDDEMKIVEQMLKEFFVFDEQVFMHDRCDDEILKYKKNIKNKSDAGKKSAKARRILKNKRKEALTAVDFCSPSVSTPVGNQEPRTKNQEPRTINQEPIDQNLNIYTPNSQKPCEENKDLFAVNQSEEQQTIPNQPGLKPLTEKQKSRKVIPPLQEDVTKYFTDNGSTEDEAKRFVGHYSDLNWKKGKTKMVGWAGSAATWIGNGKKWNQEKISKNTSAIIDTHNTGY